MKFIWILRDFHCKVEIVSTEFRKLQQNSSILSGWKFRWLQLSHIARDTIFLAKIPQGVVCCHYRKSFIWIVLGGFFLGGIFGRNSLFTLLRSAKLFQNMEYERNWCFCQDFGVMQKKDKKFRSLEVRGKLIALKNPAIPAHKEMIWQQYCWRNRQLQ